MPLKKTVIVDTETFQEKIIIEVPVVTDLIQDCYSYCAIDAPTELKSMLLEAVSDTIDEIILTHKLGEHSDKKWLKTKLSKVKIVIEN